LIEILFFVAFAFFLEWISRKTRAKVQGRYGPLYTGWKGILQPFADFIKLLTKESIVPETAKVRSLTLIPFILPVIALISFMFLPIESNIMGYSFSFEGDLILVISLLTLNSIFLWFLAYSTQSAYGNVGGMRLLLQLAAYELVYLISFATPGLMNNSLSIATISGSINLLVVPVSFLFALIVVMAKLELTPFDIPNAHQEIVAGWETEISGIRYAMIHFNSYLELTVHAFLISSLFLGANTFLSSIILSIAVVILISFFSALFARYRIDQLVKGMWKYILPLSILQMIPIYLGGLL
jgi:NADH-quinone oxidoreductase subunit H